MPWLGGLLVRLSSSSSIATIEVRGNLLSSNSGFVFKSPILHVGYGILHFYSELHRLGYHEMVSTTIAANITFHNYY
jgi:hypothetical protein